MSDASPAAPLPEPTAEDEELALEFLRIREETRLRGTPAGGQRCGTCHYVLDAGEPISTCWHDDLEIPVGRSWWCDRWTPAGQSPDAPTVVDRRADDAVRARVVTAQGWRDRPTDGQQCRTCRYYLTPDDAVSYCWRPGMQVGVGADHWCRGWEVPPSAV